MNIELMDMTIDWISGRFVNEPAAKAMYLHSDFINDEDKDLTEGFCGTSLCVAGFACAVTDFDNLVAAQADEFMGYDFSKQGATALGLTERQAHWLFLGYFTPEEYGRFGPDDTIDAIRFLQACPTFDPPHAVNLKPYSDQAMEYVDVD